MTLEKTLADALNRARARGPVLGLGVAVSGGSDSMALLNMAHGWSAAQGVALGAATVDHGLRPEAEAEARRVADTCDRLGVPHDILRWSPDVTGNLQHAARHARYDLLAGWSKAQALDAVALGHTADDQAETFLMRLARGSGVDGLSQMRDDWVDRGVRWLRPILSAERDALRGWLQDRGHGWVDDPSNDDPRFDRVRVRQAMQDLAKLGLDRSRLVETARHMREARSALSYFAHETAVRIARVEGGAVLFDAVAFRQLPAETRHRLLAHALMFVSSTVYRPRFDALCALETDVLSGTARTLQGCLVTLHKDVIEVVREYEAVHNQRAESDALWDGRWRLESAQPIENAWIAALGQGISDCPNWRASGLSRQTVLASPAVWTKAGLIAAPLAEYANGWSLSTAPEKEDFLLSILSH